MKTMNRLLSIAAILVMLLGVAGVASAGVDCDNGKFADHPQCQGDTDPDPTPEPTPELAACDELDLDAGEADRDDTITLEIPGSAQTSFECLWTPDGTLGTTVATVRITNIAGAVRDVPTVFVRDDSPGDICLLTTAEGFEWEVAPGENGPPYWATFDLAYDSVPAGYEDWLGHTYWDFAYDPYPEDPSNELDPVGTHWCAPQDTVLDSIRTDTNGTALHFMVSFNARSGGSVTVELTP